MFQFKQVEIQSDDLPFFVGSLRIDMRIKTSLESASTDNETGGPGCSFMCELQYNVVSSLTSVPGRR